jgi:NAD(P)-dependent dehydrogenase (short-subunit alcohol dehydrogenase family)
MLMETTLVNPAEIPPQHQDRQPGIEKEMTPRPIYDHDLPGYGRLKGKVALITGGDSGIGRSVAVLYAKEGADVAIVYFNEHQDAQKTAEMVKKYGKEALLIPTDLSSEVNCKNAVEKTIEKFGKLDVLVNNAAVQYEQEDIQDISAQQLEYTFKVNIFSYFHFVRYATPHLKEGSVIINTTSVTAYKGNQVLMDYSSTKGAIVSFTRSLSQALIKKGIRVNAVAPGPVWTPLIPASFDDEKVGKFGKDTPMERPAQPVEIATCYVFLASDEAAFLSGQVLHPNGGTVVNA